MKKESEKEDELYIHGRKGEGKNEESSRWLFFYLASRSNCLRFRAIFAQEILCLQQYGS